MSNDYLDPELKENNPSPPQWDKLQRNILATNPRYVSRIKLKISDKNKRLYRVTKFKINWDNNASENSENIPPPKMDPNQMSSENSQVIFIIFETLE